MVHPEYLEVKVKHLLAKYGEVDAIDVGAGFFVVHYSDERDYDLALTSGAWLLFDHYLAVQPWK